MRSDWLAGLKEGDEVVVGRYSDHGTLHRVARTTKAQIILAYPAPGVVEWRFGRKTGQEVGAAGSWSYNQLYQPTPERREAIERRGLLATAKHRIERADNVPTETLREVVRLLEGKP